MLLGFVPAVVSGVGEPGGVVDQSSVTPAKHHDPRLTQAKVGLETWSLRRGAYIVADNFYLTTTDFFGAMNAEHHRYSIYHRHWHIR